MTETQCHLGPYNRGIPACLGFPIPSLAWSRPVDHPEYNWHGEGRKNAHFFPKVYSNEYSVPVPFNQHPAFAHCASCHSHLVSGNSVVVMSFSQKLHCLPRRLPMGVFSFWRPCPCHVILKRFLDFQQWQNYIGHFSKEPWHFLRGMFFGSNS